MLSWFSQARFRAQKQRSCTSIPKNIDKPKYTKRNRDKKPSKTNTLVILTWQRFPHTHTERDTQVLLWQVVLIDVAALLRVNIHS